MDPRPSTGPVLQDSREPDGSPGGRERESFAVGASEGELEAVRPGRGARSLDVSQAFGEAGLGTKPENDS